MRHQGPQSEHQLGRASGRGGTCLQGHVDLSITQQGPGPEHQLRYASGRGGTCLQRHVDLSINQHRERTQPCLRRRIVLIIVTQQEAQG